MPKGRAKIPTKTIRLPEFLVEWLNDLTTVNGADLTVVVTALRLLSIEHDREFTDSILKLKSPLRDDERAFLENLNRRVGRDALVDAVNRLPAKLEPGPRPGKQRARGEPQTKTVAEAEQVAHTLDERLPETCPTCNLAANWQHISGNTYVSKLCGHRHTMPPILPDAADPTLLVNTRRTVSPISLDYR